MKTQYAVSILLLLLVLISSILAITILNNSNPVGNTNADTARYTYKIIQVYSHDTKAFTQGLIYTDGFLIESTGLYGQSSLRRIDLSTGSILQQVDLPYQYFGEGITVVNDKILQLTWTTKIGFIYNITNFEIIGNFSYSTQGWGITFDGEHLIISDGSEFLYFFNPTTFELAKQIKVYDKNSTINNINELEYVNGHIYANIWKQQKIAVINPDTGQIKAWVDLTGIENMENLSSEEVLNGIAYNDAKDHFFVTGKNWPHIFEIKLVLEE